MILSGRPLPRLRTLVGLAGLILVCLLLVRPAAAQAEATSLEQLVVDIWPDYDRQSVLVLLTLTRQADAGEETVVLPLPEEAELNAVARISSEGAFVTDEIEVDDSRPGQLAVTTAAPQLRIEYYMPYETENDRRQFTFSWRSEMDVEQLLATVQQPMVSRDFSLTPEAFEVASGSDGLQYHTLPATALVPGETYTLEAAYTNPGGRLTADLLADQQPSTTGVESGPTSAVLGDEGFNWAPALAAAAGVLALAVVAYLVLGNRPVRSRPRRPSPRKQPARKKDPQRSRPSGPVRTGGRAGFCHQCGHPADRGDKFCSNCGTSLKGA